jgi:hypothetical protein
MYLQLYGKYFYTLEYQNQALNTTLLSLLISGGPSDMMTHNKYDCKWSTRQDIFTLEIGSFCTLLI